MKNPKEKPYLKKQQVEHAEVEVPEEVQMHTVSAPFVGKDHVWKQQGTSIICSSCPARHGLNIKVNEMMVGVDENGMPLLAKKY